MHITSTTVAPPATAAATTDSSRAALNYDAFLRLLVAEMKNQDPTEPTDPSQSLSQLASFSAVEQNIKTNAKLDSLMTMSAISQANALIGRLVSTADGSISGTVKSIEINSAGPVAVFENGQKITLGPGIRIG